MKIEMKFIAGTVTLAAVDETIGVVALVEAPSIHAAAKLLVSRFHEMQQATIEALNASGIIRYVSEENAS